VLRRIVVRVAVGVAAVLVIERFVVGVHPVAEQSMWPALRGGEDRVCVDKLAARVRAPKRFDLWVFRFSDGTNEGLFVKRLLALPGEVIDFRAGDLFIGEGGADPARAERPLALAEAQMIPVAGATSPDGRPPWEASKGVIERAGGGGLVLRPAGEPRAVATFVSGIGIDPFCIKDDHRAGDGRVVRGRHAVPDVRITVGPVHMEGSRFSIVHELGHGELRRVVVRRSGIAVEARVDGKESQRSEHPGATCDQGLRVETRDGVFRVLLPDGSGWRELFKEPRDTIVAEGGSTLRIEADGAAVHISALEVARDVHYVWNAEAPPRSLPVPAGRLFLAGDNPEVSVDSRMFGPVQGGDLVGLVRAVVWPLPIRVLP
jgi:signal peptidase I